MTALTLQQRDARRKRLARISNRLVAIPRLSAAARKRRKTLEADVFAWLRWYFADIFTYEFTEQQREMVLAILAAVKGGGDQAIAASRGEGKTTVAECVLIYCVLIGLAKFAVLFAATGADAEHCLHSIKDKIEENDRLADDYPEVCLPVRALERTPHRASFQEASGYRYDDGRKFAPLSCSFRWSGREVILPRVPGSPASGAIIATRGLDAAVRGLKINNARPDVAIIDDPDTEETVNSEEQARKLERKIDRGIAGLAGQKRRIARVMLTTLQRRDCVSAWFTEPQTKPSWNGKRFKFLVEPPVRQDLWDEFVQLRQVDWQRQTTTAHGFYIAHREAMDAGALVANSNRHTEAELSALEFYYSEVARLGADAVATEYQNDPPEESGPVESGITPHRVQRQLNGHERKVVPNGCTVLTQGIDVRKVALHWVVRAWRMDGLGYHTIDYGTHEVLGTVYGSDQGLDLALKRAILARIEATKATEYRTPDGVFIHVKRTLIDAGWQTAAVTAACAEVGIGVWPVMGFGKSTGCTQASFHDVQHKTEERQPGYHYFLSRRGRLWLVCSDADHWKAWEHDRWMTAPGKPGCMYLFGEPSVPGSRLSADEKAHHSYAHHICNEVEIEEPYKGGVRRRWKAKSDNTHYLDASCYSNVAAAMEGIRLLKSTATPAGPPASRSQRKKVSYL
jgi:hypothetical protein